MDNQNDKTIALHIDWAMSICFEMVTELMYMKTLSSENIDDRYRLKDRIDELGDINRSMTYLLEKLNELIQIGV